MPGLNKADTCRIFVTPALQSAGWGSPHWRIAKMFFVHASRFAELCDYIKGQMDQTIQGRLDRSRGITNYNSFEEYKAEQPQHGR